MVGDGNVVDQEADDEGDENEQHGKQLTNPTIFGGERTLVEID